MWCLQICVGHHVFLQPISKSMLPAITMGNGNSCTDSTINQSELCMSRAQALNHPLAYWSLITQVCRQASVRVLSEMIKLPGWISLPGCWCANSRLILNTLSSQTLVTPEPRVCHIAQASPYWLDYPVNEWHSLWTTCHQSALAFAGRIVLQQGQCQSARLQGLLQGCQLGRARSCTAANGLPGWHYKT